MHAFHDPHTGIRIHHNGDYSGEAIMLVPMARLANDFDPDPGGSQRLAAFDITDEFGTAYEVGTVASFDDKRYVQIILPAMALVRFAATAMHDKITTELEQMDLEKMLGGDSL